MTDMKPSDILRLATTYLSEGKPSLNELKGNEKTSLMCVAILRATPNGYPATDYFLSRGYLNLFREHSSAYWFDRQFHGTGRDMIATPESQALRFMILSLAADIAESEGN